MGEKWKDHHNRAPNLKEIGGVHFVKLQKKMPQQESMALQMALAIELYLRKHPHVQQNIDFTHPWEGGLDKKDVMAPWVGDFSDGTNAGLFAAFVESLPEVEEETIDITNKQQREALLLRIGISPEGYPKTIH